MHLIWLSTKRAGSIKEENLTRAFKNAGTFTTVCFELNLLIHLNQSIFLNLFFHRFVLKGNLLYYFEKKTDKEPAGVVIVEGCTVGE